MPEDGLPPERRWRAAAALWLSILLAVTDGSIANVALPHIATDLHATASSAIWIVNAYQLAVVVVLLPLASLGEIVGYRRVYLAGLAVFTLASVACALSTSLTGLAAARALQGFGAAGIMSINTALLRHVFPAAMLGRAIALNGAFVALGSAAGPALAGAILSVGRWPDLFLLNVPFGVLAFVMASRVLPVTPRATHRFDAWSALLNVAAIGGLVGGIDLLSRGRLAPGLPLAALGLLALAALVQRNVGRRSPLLPIDLLAIPVFAAAVTVSMAAFFAITAALVAVPFLLERGLHRGSVATGLLMSAWPIATMAVAPLVGRLVDRISNRLLATAGLLVVAAALALLCRLGPGAGDADIAWRLALTGIGFSLFQVPNNREMIRAAPLARAGGAAGLLSVGRLLGQTTGALMASIVFAGSLAGLGPARQVIAIAAGIAALTALLSILRARALRLR